MVRDHERSNARLADLAKAAGIALLDELDAAHKAIRDRLQALNGADFDRAYVASQFADHQLTVQLLEYEIGSGLDAGLKAFTSDTLPLVFEHLQMAEDLAAEISKRAAAPPVPKAN